MLFIYRCLINFLFPIIILTTFCRKFFEKEDKKDLKKSYLLHHLK